MSELDNIRRDVSRLGSDLSRGMSATSVLLEQCQKHLAELGKRLDEKMRDDYQVALKSATELASIKSTLDNLERQLRDMPERVVRLESTREITGQHSLDRAEDRRLEKKKLGVEQRRAKLQFWAAIFTVAIPGALSLLWQIIGD